MGDLNSGGGGSVHWSVHSSNPRAIARVAGLKAGLHVEGGVDDVGKEGDVFLVRIKLPKGQDLAAFKQSLKQVGNNVQFNLPIAQGTKPITQIHIHWPN